MQVSALLAATKELGAWPGFWFLGSSGRICLRAFGPQLLSPAVNRRSRAGTARANRLNRSTKLSGSHEHQIERPSQVQISPARMKKARTHKGVRPS